MADRRSRIARVEDRAAEAQALMMERAQLRAQVSTATGLGISHPKVMGIVAREVRARRGGKRAATLEQEIRWVVEGGKPRDGGGRGATGPLEVVLAALPKVRGEGRFGDRKVFISALWQHVGAQTGMSLDEFKGWLFDQHRSGYLELVRGDLTSAFSPSLLRASEYVREGGLVTYHFVIDPFA